MLGLVLIYFIGKTFFNIAGLYRQNPKWLYAILGVVSYYLGSFLAGIALYVMSEVYHLFSLSDMNTLTLNFIGLPFGILMCWGFYQFLKYYWSKKSDYSDSDTLDGDFLERYEN